LNCNDKQQELAFNWLHDATRHYNHVTDGSDDKDNPDKPVIPFLPSCIFPELAEWLLKKYEQAKSPENRNYRYDDFFHSWIERLCSGLR